MLHKLINANLFTLVRVRYLTYFANAAAVVRRMDLATTIPSSGEMKTNIAVLTIAERITTHNNRVRKIEKQNKKIK